MRRCLGCRKRLQRWYTDDWCPERCLPRLWERLAAVLLTHRPGRFGGAMTLAQVFAGRQRRNQP